MPYIAPPSTVQYITLSADEFIATLYINIKMSLAEVGNPQSPGQSLGQLRVASSEWGQLRVAYSAAGQLRVRTTQRQNVFVNLYLFILLYYY